MDRLVTDSIGANLSLMKMGMRLLTVYFAGMLSVFAGSPQGAEQIVKEYRLAELEWQQKMLASTSSSQKAEAAKLRPDSARYGARMVGEIGNSLKEEWAVTYAVWLLQHHSSLSAQGVVNMIGFAEDYHMNSSELGKFTIALIQAGGSDPQKAQQIGLFSKKMVFIEKVMKEAPTKRVQGEAALALSNMLGRMGEEGTMNKRRLDLLRKAIIDSADSNINGVTLADLAQEELYRMKNLSKGVSAPEITGVDSALKNFKLSDYRGKVVMLVFWTSWEDYLHALQYLTAVQKQHVSRPLAIVGVNRDSLANLRELVKAGKTIGRTFSDPEGKLFHAYRVGASPWCYVLDKEGVIHYSGPLGSFAELTASALLAPEQGSGR